MTEAKLTKRRRERPNIIKLEMKKRILQQIAVKCGTSVRNIIENISSKTGAYRRN
jgi:hypothetical protein